MEEKMLSKKQERAMRLDFKNFLFVIWKHLGLPEPTPVQYNIADYLQHGPRRLQIQAFRGIGKSYILATFATWLLWNNKELKILVISAGMDRAMAFSVFVKNLIRDVPFLKAMMPDKSVGERDSQAIFDVRGVKPSGSPSVKSVGITSQITGTRADYILSDDVEIVSNSLTNELREKLASLVAEYDAIIVPGGRTIFLGTPQNSMTIYNTLYDRGYEMKIWTARVPTKDEGLSYGAKLADFIRDKMLTEVAGAPVDPKRFDNEDLMERELSYGRSAFALQFMLNTDLSDQNKFPLRINDLIVSNTKGKLPNEIYWSSNPLHVLKDVPNVATGKQKFYGHESLSDGRSEPQMSVMSIDVSGRGSDETSYSVGHLLNGNIFVTESGGLIGGYSDDVLIQLCEIAKRNKVNTVLCEVNMGDAMFNQLLKPHMSRIYPCSIEEVRHHTQKEARIIDTLEPLLNQHRLIVDPNVIKNDYDTARENYPPEKAPQYMLFYQMSRISRDRGSLKHDDRLDALAMMVKYFLDYLDVDQTTQNSIRQEESTDRLLAGFANDWLDEHGGNKNSIRLWTRRK